MKNWTVRQLIVLSFSAVIIAMMVMGAVAYAYLSSIKHEAGLLLSDSMPGLHHSQQIATNLWENYSLTQESVQERDKAALEKLAEDFKASWKKLSESVQNYRETLTTEEDEVLFKDLEQMLTEYRNIQPEVVKLSSGPDATGAHAMMVDKLRPKFRELETLLEKIVASHDRSGDAQAKLILDAIRSADIGMLIVFLAGLALAVISGYLLMRAITRPLNRLVTVADTLRQGDFTQRANLNGRDEFSTLARGFDRMTDELTALVGQVQHSSLQVNTSVTEIAATAKQQQATASEIAATTTEISATSKEISATSKELVKTMNEVSDVAEQSATLASNGQVGLARMEETMQHVVEAAGSINAKLAVLNEKAGNINQVVTTITKVADQTNLLSLNAAIEAEKAGEYGRGFAVVATEIRRLADQTAVATYDIEQMVKEIQSAVSAGVMGMDKFSEEVRRGVQDIHQVGGQLSQIIQQVQTLAPRFEAVNEGMEAQADGAEQIAQALVQLGEAAQQTVESLHQSNVAIEGLNQVSNGLRAGISRIKLQA